MTTMKKIIASIFAFAAVLSLNAANVSSNASATLEHNVSVSKVTTDGTYGTNVVKGKGDLLFGNILITGAGGSVTVGANNLASYTAGAAAGSAGTIAAAAFQVTGIQGNTYAVTIPDATIKRSTGELLSVAFNHNATGTISATADNNVFMVGGTLSIPENARVGSYSGSFAVTIEYN
jgi:Mat/Ecp fimbriae major subunit